MATMDGFSFRTQKRRSQTRRSNVDCCIDSHVELHRCEWFMSVSDFCSLTSHYCTSNSSTYYTLILVDIVPDHSPSGGAFCNTVELGMKIISPKNHALPFRVHLKFVLAVFRGS